MSQSFVLSHGRGIPRTGTPARLGTTWGTGLNKNAMAPTARAASTGQLQSRGVRFVQRSGMSCTLKSAAKLLGSDSVDLPELHLGRDWDVAANNDRRIVSPPHEHVELQQQPVDALPKPD